MLRVILKFVATLEKIKKKELNLGVLFKAQKIKKFSSFQAFREEGKTWISTQFCLNNFRVTKMAENLLLNQILHINLVKLAISY